MKCQISLAISFSSFIIGHSYFIKKSKKDREKKIMKRKVLLGLLAFGGGLTVVGSGFSAWYFKLADLESNHNVDHYVTEVNSGIGTLMDLNKGQNLYVVFDQGGYANSADLTKGISIRNVTTGAISDSNLGEVVEFIGATYTLTKENWTTLTNAGITSGTFKSTFTLSDTAANYIKFKPAGNDYIGQSSLPDNDKGLTITDKVVTYEYTVTFPTTWELAEGVDFEKTIKFDCNTPSTGDHEGVNTMLQYKTGEKPTTKDAYDTMKSALDGAKDHLLTLEYTFTVGAAA